MECEPIVIDTGSGFVKAGLSKEIAPSAVFPAVVGRLRFHGINFPYQKEIFVGEEAFAASTRSTVATGNAALRFPVDKGCVTNWDDVEAIWHHTFYNELRVAPEEHPVLMTEAPLQSSEQRERMTQVMFESFNVPALYAAYRPVLSLYALGQLDGLVVQSGDSATSAVPVLEGYLLPSAIVKGEYGGRNVGDHMLNLMMKREGFTMRPGPRTTHTLMRAKEALAALSPFVSSRSGEEGEERMEEEGEYEASYTLPDGTVLTLTLKERYLCGEAMFTPSLAGIEQPGVSDCVSMAITGCTDEALIQSRLYGNIVLSGGNSMMRGFRQRLETDVIARAPVGTYVQVTGPEDGLNGGHQCWLGGAILSSLSSFQSAWIIKEEYDETGPTIIHRKCPA